MEKRIVKIPMPADLIRRMDEVLAQGKGGLETREQFIREAAEGLLAELTYSEAPPEPGPRVTSAATSPEGSASIAGALESVPPWEQEELRLADLAGSALRTISPGASLSAGVVRPRDEPLLGLHNRDYPSLWAAARLARYTEDGLISVEEFWRRVTAAAWLFGAQLQALEQEIPGLRITPLFPTNPRKQEAAEQAFQSFALGGIPRRRGSEGAIEAGGPLFDWRLCQMKMEDGGLLIGLTPTGRELLRGLAGLTLELPHGEPAARLFLGHLFANAPGERWGFEQILSAALEEPTREELVATVAEGNSRWTEATANSVAQGYVARAREWGLLEVRLQQGRYRLTEFGARWRRENADGQMASVNEREDR